MRLPRYLSAAAAAGALGLSAGAAACAQTAPAPSASAAPAPAPAASATPAPGELSPGTNSQARPVSVVVPSGVGHLPVIDIVPTYTESGIGGFNKKTSRVLRPLQPVDVGGTVTFPITRKYSISYDRIVQGVFSQFLEPQGALLPAIAQYRDVVSQYRIDDRMSARWLAEGGFYFRHRTCCPASSAVAGVGGQGNFASSEYHWGYLGMTYTTPPWRWLNYGSVSLKLNGYDASVNHHVATSRGTTFDQDPSKNKYITSSESLTVVYPIDRKHATFFIASDTIGDYGFSNNYTQPAYYTGIVTFQLTKTFTKNFSLGLRTTNIHQAPKQNSPLPLGVIHLDEVSVVADIKLDFNQFHH